MSWSAFWPLHDSLDLLVGQQPRRPERQLAAHHAAVGHDDPPPISCTRETQASMSASAVLTRGGGGGGGATIFVRVVGDGRANAPRCSPNPVTSPTPTRPLAWWRSATAILAMSRVVGQ